MKAQRATATRYARALFESAPRPAPRSSASDGSSRASTPSSPSSPSCDRCSAARGSSRRSDAAIARAVAERAGAGRLVRDFVALVAGRNRIDHLAEIADVYRGLVDDSLGRVRAQVRSAVPLSADERSQLGARLERLLGQHVVLEETVDPSSSAASSPRSAASFSTAVSTGSSRACASAWQGDSE